MESGKRKRTEDLNDGEERKLRKGHSEENNRAVTDAEVEEFFAILRRMHDASRCFAVSRPAEAERRWMPSFVWEDFEVADAVNGDGGKGVSGGNKEERVAESGIPRGLDLNADPEPEGVGLASPRGQSTARCTRAPA